MKYNKYHIGLFPFFITFLFVVYNSNISAQRLWSNVIGQYPYNPAGASMNDLGEIDAVYYNTYASANNNPRGYLLMGSTSLPYDNMGVGFKFTSEPGGVIKNTMAEMTYVYKINTGRNTKLAFGLSGVYGQVGIDNTLINPQHPLDPLLQEGAQSDYWFDADFGLSFYQVNSFYAGLAVYNLAGQSTNWMLSDFESRKARLLSLTGMYSYNFLNGDIKAELSGVGLRYLPQDDNSMVYDFTLRGIYKKSFWLGTGVTNHMAKILAGIYVQNITVGYAGCIGMGDISEYAYSFPKHEFFLRLELNTSKQSKAGIKN